MSGTGNKVWLAVSAPTWNLSNNLVAHVVLDGWFNLFGSLFTNPFTGHDYLSSEALSSSDRLGSFGLRRDGVIAAITGGRAFTTAHLVWSAAKEFDELLATRVVDPQGRFEPTLYGTLLRVAPDGAPAFVLLGGPLGWIPGADLPRSWSRAGGPAEAVAPGVRVPWFPSGGLHLDSSDPTGTNPVPIQRIGPAEVVEVAPTALATGTLSLAASVTLPAGVAPPAVGDLVLLEDPAGPRALLAVASVRLDPGGAVLRVDGEATGLAATGISLSAIQGAPLSSEDRPSVAVAGAPGALSTTGATATYAAGDLLRLLPPGAPAGAVPVVARATGLEARLALDRALPGTLSGTLTVSRTTVGTATAVTRTAASTLQFTGPPPAVGSAGVVRGGATAVPVLVLTAPDATTVTVDADVSALAAPLTFAPLAGGPTIGTRAGGPEADAHLTYVPASSGTAPDGSGAVTVVRVDATGGAAVRLVVGAPEHDAVLVDRAPPAGATVHVDRLAVGPLHAGRDLARAAIVVARPAAALDGADVVAAHRITPPGAGAGTAATVTGSTLVIDPVPAALALGSLPSPGQVAWLAQGTTTEAVLVTGVSVQVTLDRPVTLDGTNVAVPLSGAGPTLPATRLDATRFVLDTTAGSPFARLAVGEVISVTWAGGGPGRYRVSTVDGLEVTVDGPVALGDAGAGAPTAALQARRLQPRANRATTTGTRVVARAGATVGAAPAAVCTFDVWSPDDLSGGTGLGVVVGDRTVPVEVQGRPARIVLRLAAPPAAAGAVNVSGATSVRSLVGTVAHRDGDTFTLDGAPPDLATAAGETLALVAYTDAADAPRAAGRVHPGSLLVPNDETLEIDRKQSLIDHELTHTVQYSRWGPLWFGWNYLLPLELPVTFAADAELPEYSAFLSGTMTAGAAGQFDLQLPQRSGVTIAVGDVLQVLRGPTTSRVTVRAVSGDTFTVNAKDGDAPPTGEVHVRKHQDGAGGWETLLSVLQFVTPGGLANFFVGSTWGGLAYGIGKLGWLLGRLFTGGGERHPATVADGRTRLDLTDADGQQAIRDGRVIVKKDGDGVVRTGRREGNALRLDTALPASMADGATVDVSPYGTLEPGDYLDWLSYHPATVDAATPAVLTLDTDDPHLSAFDRVEVRYRDSSRRYTVNVVDGRRVELSAPLSVPAGGETSARIAKVDSTDPLGGADAVALEAMGMGWMQYLFDPWGHLQYGIGGGERTQPGQDRSTRDWVLRVLRYLFGTRMWSVLPSLGYLWWARFIVHQDHTAAIEQEASAESGDLYSAVGRLGGQVSRSGTSGSLRVGDVVRYRAWSGYRHDTTVDGGMQDGPGTHLDRDVLRVVPPGGANPGSGVALATDLTDKRGGTPDDPPENGPAGFAPAELAMVPTSATLARTIGAFVAFTRPSTAGSATATVRDGLSGRADAREVNDKEEVTLQYGLDVADVEVKVNGRAVAEGDVLEVLVRQPLTVAVDPGGDRVHRVTVGGPVRGDVLRPTGERTLEAQKVAGDVRVEVSRFYAFRDGAYSPGGLAGAGRHLGGDLDVAVRQVTVRVGATVPVRTDATATSPATATLARGTAGFIVVPAPIVSPPVVTTVDGAAPAAGFGLPTVQRAAGLDADTRAWVGAAGAVFEVTFPAPAAGAPPLPDQDVVLTTQVGLPGDATNVTTTVRLTT